MKIYEVVLQRSVYQTVFVECETEADAIDAAEREGIHQSDEDYDNAQWWVTEIRKHEVAS